MTESLAVELYLKALVKHATGTAPFGHDAVALYNQLPSVMQADLDKGYSKLVESRSGFDTGVFVHDTLRDALLPYRSALSDWRYPHEKGQKDRIAGNHQSGYLAGLLRSYCQDIIGYRREFVTPYEEYRSRQNNAALPLPFANRVSRYLHRFFRL